MKGLLFFLIFFILLHILASTPLHYIMLRFLLSFLFLLLPLGIYAQTLHIILVSDLENRQFGLNGLRSQEQMLEVFETVSQKLNYKTDIIYLNKRTFTSQTVKNTIKRLRTQTNDIIIFYYTGLGYYPANSQSKYPFLQLNDHLQKPLSLDEIGNLLLAKQVRLGVALADCPNEKLTVEKTIVERTPPQSLTIKQADLRRSILKTMFLGECGLLKASSTQPNQKSFLVTDNITTIQMSIENEKDTLKKNTETRQKGAIFTHSFYNSFKNLLKNVSVEAIKDASLTQLMKNTQATMNEELNPMQTTNNEQTAMWEFVACNATIKQQMVKLPPYLYPSNNEELQAKLNQVIATREVRLRNEFAARLNDLFAEEAFVTVVQTNGYPPKHPKFQTRINRLDTENYFVSLAASAEKIKTVTIKNTMSRGQFLLEGIEIEEVWK